MSKSAKDCKTMLICFYSSIIFNVVFLWLFTVNCSICRIALVCGCTFVELPTFFAKQSGANMREEILAIAEAKLP